MNQLIKLLTTPELIKEFSLSDWNQVIIQGRSAGMLGKLHHILQDQQLLDMVPHRPGFHLQSERIIADRHAEITNFEIINIYEILERAGIPVIILKGAAYSFGHLSPSSGRAFGDIDIMVPRGALVEAEKYLKRGGWMATHHSEYDDKYYRRWMHEIPPLIHRNRQTVLDIHHNILPLTANLKPQANDLWDKAIPVENYQDLYLLAKSDMILHSATHLFQEGEFDRGLRDLYDIAQLIEEFKHEDAFWENLFERAKTLDLVLPLMYALRYAHKILNTPIPSLNKLANSKKAPSEMHLVFMDKLFINALCPTELSKNSYLKSITNWMLYVRGHYLKMPLHLLIPHLLYKATLAKREDKTLAEEKKTNLLKEFLDA